MKKLFANFWKRNLGFLRLAVITNLEYRFNYITDAIIQPIAAVLIELTLWFAVFRSSGTQQIGGFTRDYYIAYAIWAGFISRITANWMYEMKMISDIDSGAVNSVLVRPISFYEYYLSQFLGYKLVTTAISMLIPIGITLCIHSPTQLLRLPLTLALVIYYVVMVHTLSFMIASLALYFNRIHSITVAKNLLLWLLSGELFPLDIMPGIWKNITIALPFSSAVYVPAGYLTGRFGVEGVLQAFASVTCGILFFAAVSRLLWMRGMRNYSGTGA